MRSKEGPRRKVGRFVCVVFGFLLVAFFAFFAFGVAGSGWPSMGMVMGTI